MLIQKFKMNFTCDTYCKKPFISDTLQADFFTHISIKDLLVECEANKEKSIKFRTIGVLESIDGIFYVKDINLPDKVSSPKIQVCLSYMKGPPQCAVCPYTLQLFGTVLWKGKPVIHANIIQILNTGTAIKMNEAVTNIIRRHLAHKPENKEF